MSNILGSVTIGQGVWAISQSLIMFVLAADGNIELVGFVTLGLAIFSPLCLLGGFNLRNTIAISNGISINPLAAFLFRFLIITIALAITLSIIGKSVDGQYEIYQLAALLIIGRSLDQLSDVAIGYYQCSGRLNLIARSFLFRGIFGVLPFLVLLIFNISLITATVFSIVFLLITVLIHDVIPVIYNRNIRLNNNSSQTSFIEFIAMNKGVALYPSLDNLHFNMLRIAVYVFNSAEMLGLIGLAQTLYAPFQLLISALGYKHLTLAKTYYVNQNTAMIISHFYKGISIGLLVGGGFFILILLSPVDYLLAQVGLIDIQLAHIAMFVALAVIPLGASGFSAQSMLSVGMKNHYTIAPALGVVTFSALLFISHFILDLEVSFGLIAITFLFSGAIRLSYSILLFRKVFSTKGVI